MERSHNFDVTLERSLVQVPPVLAWSSDEKMYNLRTLVKILSPVVIILITTSLLRRSEERPNVGLRPQKTIKTKELLWLLTELALIPPEAPVNQTCRPPEIRQ